MKGENQPNALILCYPGITTRFWKGHGYDKFFGDRNPDEIKEMLDCNNHIGPHTPPAFLVHTFVDNCVPVNESLEFARVLDANDIPFEYMRINSGMVILRSEIIDSIQYIYHLFHLVSFKQEYQILTS